MFGITGTLPSGRHVLSAAAFAAASLALSACGGGAAKGGEETQQAALPSKKATGQPITVGLINTDASPLGNYADVRKAVQAGAAYVNDSLGGVNGRPIKVVSCATNGSAPASANCAAELLRAEPSVVIGGFDPGAGGSVPALAEGGVPYVGAAAVGAVEFTSPNAYSLVSAAPGSMRAAAAYVADELAPKRVAVMFNETPEARAAAEHYVGGVLRQKGVRDVALVAYGVTEPDLAGPLSQALKGGTEVVVGIMPAAGCANVMKAKQALGSTAEFFFPGNCADPQVIKAGGSGAKGAYFSSTMQVIHSDDPEVQQFRAAMAKYDKSVSLSGLVQGGFGTVVSLSKLMAKAEKPDSPQAVWDVLKNLKNEPTFMGPKVTCDGKQLAGLPSICTKKARIGQIKGGELVDVGGRWFAG